MPLTGVLLSMLGAADMFKVGTPALITLRNLWQQQRMRVAFVPWAATLACPWFAACGYLARWACEVCVPIGATQRRAADGSPMGTLRAFHVVGICVPDFGSAPCVVGRADG